MFKLLFVHGHFSRALRMYGSTFPREKKKSIHCNELVSQNYALVSHYYDLVSKIMTYDDVFQNNELR